LNSQNLNKIFGTLAFLILIAATWLTLSHQPIAQKINVRQAGIKGDNEYYPAFTIFILALPPLLLLFGLKKLLLYRADK